MNRKALSLLIVVVMALSIVPVGFTYAAVNIKNPEQKLSIRYSVPLIDDTGIFLKHGLGLRIAPLNEYTKITGFNVPQMDERAYHEAVKYAPFNPLATPVIITPHNISSFNATSLPVEAVNTLYLPPIGNQGYVGSCNAWASTYYVWTYMVNWWRNNPHPSSVNDIMNPTFTYNLINGGEDSGSLPWDAMNLISTIGAVPLSAFPLYVYGPYGDPADYAYVWPNLTQWMMAPHNSGTGDMYWWQFYEPGTPELYQIPGQWYYLNLTNETQFDYTKGLLSSGYVLETTINVLPSFNFIGHPEQFLGYLVFYANYSQIYANELWNKGNYSTWTVQDLLDEAQKEYNSWAVSFVNSNYNGNQTILQIVLAQGQYSLELITKDLSQLGVSLNDTVVDAASKLLPAVYEKFISNQSWWNNATYYLNTYSINGEKWFLNNGFNYLFALANFEWMIHYVPLGKYGNRVPYLDFYNYYAGLQGGHAVTIIGYDDNMTTPDGKGAFVMVNSWGTDWGHNGYWYFSYQAITSAGQYFNTVIDGILPVSFQIEWPVMYGGSSALVYVPKAANYTPELMAVVGIKHPVRGEVVDGVYGDTQFIPAGIPVGVVVGNDTWSHNFLDFWMNYLWSDITNKTTAAELPQDHPFPDSPMAFDISGAIQNVTYYILETGSTPLYATFFVVPHDLLKDNITGDLYNFTILLNIDGHYVTVGSINGSVSIPDGGQTVVPLTVPLVNYYSAPDNVSINYGNLDVSIYSLIPLEGAEIVIDGKSYPLSAEDGGYYYYATGIDQKLKLPAGTYNYTVVVTYPNGKKVALPERTVTIKEPVVQILSPEPKVYNTSEIGIAVNVVDVLNITRVFAEVGGKTYNLTYNKTIGLYTGNLNLTSGSYTLNVIALDVANNTGIATLQFVVQTNAKVVSVPVNNETNVTVGIIGNANITAENNTVVAKVETSNGTVTVEVPLVNNVQSVVVNTTAVETVVSGQSNVSLAAGWNATISSIKVKKEKIKQEDNKVLYSVTLKANVSLGENGVAVVALRNINISKIYVWKNGQKIQLTTDKNNPIGYYYTENGVIFVVLKEDPVIEADGTFVETLPKTYSSGVSLAALNFLGYRWYNLYLNKFNELYQKAVQLGVDNETLNKALQFNQTAGEYYKKVLELTGGNIILHLGDVRILAPLRKAYLNEMRAVEVLKEALERLETQS